MGWLPEIKDALETEVLERVTYVPNQELDLLVFYASSHLETDQPQVVGVAVTRHGIPVRAWSWPGVSRLGAGPPGTDDLGLGSARITWVANRGFSAAAAAATSRWTAGTATSSALSCGPVPPRPRPP